MTNWKIQNGQVSIFPFNPKTGSLEAAHSLFRKLWNTDPQNFQTQPSGAPLAGSNAEGPVNGFNGSAAINPLRADFILAPPAQFPPTDTLPVVDDADAFWSEFERISTVVATLDLGGEIARIASIVHLVNVQPDVVAANKIISAVLPESAKVTLSDEQDFVLQMNKRRQSASVGGTAMNFITKWTVERFQFLSFTVGGAPTPTMSQTVPLVERIAAHVSLDNNNVPARALKPQERASLLKEANDASKAAQRRLFGMEN